MRVTLLRPFPLFVLAAAAACSGVVGFTVSAGQARRPSRPAGPVPA
jgi:hypothetical protein